MRARALRMVPQHQGSFETQSAAVAAIAPKIGCVPETLRVWVRQAEKDSGARDGATSAERERIKELERECLNAHWFLTLADAREKLATWRRHYNEDRPHGAIGYNVPITLHYPGDAASPSP